VQRVPLYVDGHVHVPGLEHVPLFEHTGLHTAKFYFSSTIVVSSLNSTYG